MRMRLYLLWSNSHAPLEDHALATHREPSALYCWIPEILYCNPKGRRALLRIPSTEGRSVCLCWAKSKPQGPKGRTRPTWGLVCMRARSSGLTQVPDQGPPFRHLLRAICTVLLDPRDPLLRSERTQGFTADPVYGRFAHVGRNQNLKDLKSLPMLGSLKT